MFSCLYLSAKSPEFIVFWVLLLCIDRKKRSDSIVMPLRFLTVITF